MNNEVNTTPLGEPMWEGEVTYSMAQKICNGLERIKPEHLEAVLKRFAFEWLAMRQENAALRAEREIHISALSQAITKGQHDYEALEALLRKIADTVSLQPSVTGLSPIKRLDDIPLAIRDLQECYKSAARSRNGADLAAENAQLRANLAIADEHIGTLKTDLGKMADALARMQGPINKDDKDADGKWADDNKKTELTFEDGYSALIAARAGKGNESR